MTECGGASQLGLELGIELGFLLDDGVWRGLNLGIRSVHRHQEATLTLALM